MRTPSCTGNQLKREMNSSQSESFVVAGSLDSKISCLNTVMVKLYHLKSSRSITALVVDNTAASLSSID